MLRLALLFLAAATATAAGEVVRITLHEHATVGHLVTLADVADVSDDAVGNIALSIDNGQITLEQVTQALAAAGVRSDRVLLRGPEHCTIVRRAEVSTDQPIHDDGWGVVAKPTVELAAATPTTRPAIVHEPNQPRSSAKVGETVAVVRVIRPIARDAIVQREDVRVDRVHVRRKTTTGPTLEQVVGRRAARSMKVGATLRSRDIVAPLLVRRGQRLVVTLQRGGLDVRSLAVAKEDGGFGQTVRCESESTGETLRVTLTGPQAGTVAY
jgi:flagella basal body P-ring formation protein FlgA